MLEHLPLCDVAPALLVGAVGDNGLDARVRESVRHVMHGGAVQLVQHDHLVDVLGRYLTRLDLDFFYYDDSIQARYINSSVWRSYYTFQKKTYLPFINLGGAPRSTLK